MLGPQGSPPARIQRNQVGFIIDLNCELLLIRATRAGGDACGPSTEVSDYFHSFYRLGILALCAKAAHSNSKNETVNTTLYVSSEPESEPQLMSDML